MKENKENKEVDLTDLGEKWVDISLDLQTIIKNVPKGRPYSIMYSWGVEDEKGKFVSSSQVSCESEVAFMCGLQSIFKHDVKTVPLVCAAISSYIMTLPEDRQQIFRDACIEVLNHNDLALQ